MSFLLLVAVIAGAAYLHHWLVSPSSEERVNYEPEPIPAPVTPQKPRRMPPQPNHTARKW